MSDREMGPIQHPEIAEQLMTCICVPEQYQGKLKDGRTFYFRCRFSKAWLGAGGTLDKAVDNAFENVPYVWTDEPYGGMFETDEQRDSIFADLYEQIRTPDVNS